MEARLRLLPGWASWLALRGLMGMSLRGSWPMSSEMASLSERLTMVTTGVVLACKVVQKARHLSSGHSLRQSSLLNGDGVDEVTSPRSGQWRSTLLNYATHPLTIGSDITDELAVLSRFEHQLAKSLPAKIRLRRPASPGRSMFRQIRDIVHGRYDISSSEVPGVVAKHATKVDLDKILGVEAAQIVGSSEGSEGRKSTVIVESDREVNRVDVREGVEVGYGVSNMPDKTWR